MKEGMFLEGMLEEVLRRRCDAQDMLVSCPDMSHLTSPDGGVSTLTITGRAEGGDWQVSHPVGKRARGQLLDALGINRTYAENCRNAAPDLLDINVNRWLQIKRTQRQLVRILDGNVRAVLSDEYRRIDNWEIAQYLIPEIAKIAKQIPLQFVSVNVSDDRMYIKLLAPSVSCEVDVGDVVQAGVVISNSEVGAGCFWVSELLYRCKCRNGLILPDTGMKKRHVGRVASGIATNLLSEETLRAENQTLILTARDVIRASLNGAKLQEQASRLRRLLKMPIVAEDQVKPVEILKNHFQLSQQDRTGIIRELMSDTHMSAFGLLNAVTAYSQKVDDYDLATNLEIVGGALLKMPDSDWDLILSGKAPGRKAVGKDESGELFLAAA